MSDTLAQLVNHQVRLAARPVGLPTPANWQFTEEKVAEPEDGGLVVKVLALSLDPAMRGWMNEGKSYIPPVGIGEVELTAVIDADVDDAALDRLAASTERYCVVGQSLRTPPTVRVTRAS